MGGFTFSLQCQKEILYWLHKTVLERNNTYWYRRGITLPILHPPTL